jgi:hypothetical protein
MTTLLTPERDYKYFFQLGKIQIDTETSCWIWLGSQYPDGYGKIRARKVGGGWTCERAQRYFYKLHHGQVPREVDTSHSCHRRLCVRLKHIKPLTHTENMRLMFIDWGFGDSDLARLRELVTEGRTISYIADALMAPRPYIMKILKQLNGAQDDIFS